MRARWDFYFDSTGVRFDAAQHYDAQITKEHAQEAGLPAQAFNAGISIEPDEESRNPLVEQTGKLKITIPGDREATKDLAFWLARHVAQQITFSQGEIKINYGLVLGEHLPDTPEETEQLGDKPFFGEAHLIQAPPSPVFDGSTLNTISSSGLIQQFNAADGAKNPVDRFLGMFKILEDLFGPTSRKEKLADSLKGSDELFQLAGKLVQIKEKGKTEKIMQTKADFLGLVDKLVKTRHECAHLRSSQRFGIAHGNPRASVEVEPLAKLLRALAFAAVQKHLQRITDH